MFGPEVLWWVKCWVTLGRPQPNTDNFTKRRKPADQGNCYRVTEHGATKSWQSCGEGSLDDCWEYFLADQAKPASPWLQLLCCTKTTSWAETVEPLRNGGHDVWSCSHLASIQPLTAITCHCAPPGSAWGGDHVIPAIFLHREGVGQCTGTFAKVPFKKKEKKAPTTWRPNSVYWLMT